MSKRYGMRPGLSAVYLPEAGKVSAGRVLAGEAFAKFCPTFLIEIDEPVVLEPIVEPVVITAKPEAVKPLANGLVEMQERASAIPTVGFISALKEVLDHRDNHPITSDTKQDGATSGETSSEMLESELKRGRGRPKKRLF